MGKLLTYILIILVLTTPFVKVKSTYAIQGEYISQSGEKIPLRDHNDTYIVLDAFATWCQPCQIEMTHLNDVYDVIKDKEDVKLLSISMSPDTDTIPKIKSFMEKYNGEWEYGLDKDGDLKQFLNVTGYPTTFIISPDGEILKKWLGLTESDIILEELDKYVDLPGSFGRNLDLNNIINRLFNSVFFQLFFVLMWISIFYSGFKVINKMKSVE